MFKRQVLAFNVTSMALAALAGLTGCDQPQMSMQDMQPPPRPAELDRLEPMVGEWDTEMTMTMPGSDKPMTSKGSSSIKWGLDKNYLVEHVQGDMGEMGKFQGMSVMSYDAKDKVYRMWWFDSMGAVGEGTLTCDAGGKTWNGESEGDNLRTGQKSRGYGGHTMVDNNTIDWNWRETDMWGRETMKMTGKNKRKM